MIRLDKFLVDAGIGTRSEVKKYIKKKQVKVNGSSNVSPEQKIDEEKDSVCYLGEEISYEKYAYYLFHKPAGCVTAKTDKTERTVMDYFPEQMRRKFSPVGRLDKDTEGLLIITNDGAFHHRLVSPAYHVPKTYEAVLDKPVPAEAVPLFQEGVDIGDEKKTLPAELTIFPPEDKDGKEQYRAKLVIMEGRYHQVKRMFLAVGCTVTYLKRVSIGSLSLQNLPKGEYRRLTEQEVEDLREISSEKKSI